jgi:hypothetical protein
VEHPRFAAVGHAQAFAAFVKKNLGDVAVMDNGRYISPKINNYWLLWEESREQAIKQEEQQPVPVKTYSGGRAWPMQTGWVELTEDERRVLSWSCGYDDYYELVENVEAKLKEKNSKG